MSIRPAAPLTNNKDAAGAHRTDPRYASTTSSAITVQHTPRVETRKRARILRDTGRSRRGTIPQPRGCRRTHRRRTRHAPAASARTADLPLAWSTILAVGAIDVAGVDDDQRSRVTPPCSRSGTRRHRSDAFEATESADFSASANSSRPDACRSLDRDDPSKQGLFRNPEKWGVAFIAGLAAPGTSSANTARATARFSSVRTRKSYSPVTFAAYWPFARFVRVGQPDAADPSRGTHLSAPRDRERTATLRSWWHNLVPNARHGSSTRATSPTATIAFLLSLASAALSQRRHLDHAGCRVVARAA